MNIGGAGYEGFTNWLGGSGFRTDRGVVAYNYERGIEIIRALCANIKDAVISYGTRGLAKNKSLDPATIGPKHSYTNDGSPWEMGPDISHKIQTSNTIGDLSSWDTHITTQKAIDTGVSSKPVNIEASSWGWKEAGQLYEQTWIDQPYMKFSHNSNYATATRIYGAGGNVPEGDDLGWAPQFR